MIKVFDTTQEYNTYTSNGLQSGDLYYVLDDGSVHFRTNNIDGTDKVYDKGDGGSTPEPQYTELNLNTFPAQSNGKNFSTLITATVGQTIEIYNPNHLNFAVGPGHPNINPVDGAQDGYYIGNNGIFSYYETYNNGSITLEHLYVTNAPNTMDNDYSDYGFCIAYFSAAGTPTDGVIYYRIID